MSTVSKINGPLNFCPGFRALQNDCQGSAGLLQEIGTSTNPQLDNGVASKNFFSYYLKTTATSGTTRGLYLRLYLASGAGGEAARFFTTVSSNTPADTVNGVHSSLSFGASAGNITGLGTGGRFTLHIPGRAINATIAALQAEMYGDAASGDVGGTASLLRLVIDGNSDFKGNFDDKGFLVDVQGLTAGSAHAFRTGLTAATINAATTCALRIRVGATTYYIPVATATA